MFVSLSVCLSVCLFVCLFFRSFLLNDWLQNDYNVPYVLTVELLIIDLSLLGCYVRFKGLHHLQKLTETELTKLERKRNEQEVLNYLKILKKPA